MGTRNKTSKPGGCTQSGKREDKRPAYCRTTLSARTDVVQTPQVVLRKNKGDAFKIREKLFLPFHTCLFTLRSTLVM